MKNTSINTLCFKYNLGARSGGLRGVPLYLSAQEYLSGGNGEAGILDSHTGTIFLPVADIYNFIRALKKVDEYFLRKDWCELH